MRIVLFGYYGFGNAGDEAVLAGLLHGLRRHGPRGAEYIVLSGDPQQTERLHGVRALPRRRWRTLLKESGRADLWIFGGGSLLQDVSGPLSLPFYLSVIGLLRLRRCSFVLHGHGIGPIRGRINRVLTGTLLRRATRISVRDVDSGRELVAMGVPAERIALGADPAFLLPPPAATSRSEEAEPLIGLSLRPWTGSDTWLPELLAGLQAFARRIRARLLLVPMDDATDRRLALEVQRELGEICTVCDAEEDYARKAGMLASCDLVVAMRLHAGLLAALGLVPSVLLSYDPKVDALADLLNLNVLAISDLKRVELESVLDEAWQRRHAAARELAIATTTLRMAAEEDLLELVTELEKRVEEKVESG